MKQLALIGPLLVTACATEPETLDEVSQQSTEQELDQLVWQYCAMTRDGVTTYNGLTGTYQRMGLYGVDEPVRLSLTATDDEHYVRGTFSGTFRAPSGAITAYAGRYGALPDNPAIGAAFMLDTNSDGEYDKLYFVLAMRRSFGQVRGLCLEGAEHPFLLARTYF
jgi:hypothetical protein